MKEGSDPSALEHDRLKQQQRGPLLKHIVGGDKSPQSELDQQRLPDRVHFSSAPSLNAAFRAWRNLGVLLGVFSFLRNPEVSKKHG